MFFLRLFILLRSFLIWLVRLVQLLLSNWYPVHLRGAIWVHHPTLSTYPHLYLKSQPPYRFCPDTVSKRLFVFVRQLRHLYRASVQGNPACPCQFLHASHPCVSIPPLMVVFTNSFMRPPSPPVVSLSLYVRKNAFGIPALAVR